VRTDHQELDGVFVQDPVSNQAQLIGHTELVDMDTIEVIDLGLVNPRIVHDGPYGFVEIGLLPTMKFLDRARSATSRNDHQRCMESPRTSIGACGASDGELEAPSRERVRRQPGSNL